MAKAARRQSDVDKNMYEATGASAIGEAPAPGASTYGDVNIEGLGKLSDFPTSEQIKNSDAGTGEWCVVTCDFLSGSGPEDYFKKGNVVRLSKLVRGLDNPEISRDQVKADVKRLFVVRAIRLATSDEVAQGYAVVTMETESAAVQSERQRRMAVERENEVLREALQNAGLAATNATAGKAGASEQAQNATVADTSGDKQGKGPKNATDDLENVNWDDE